MHAQSALAGLTITYALQVTGFLNWVVRMGTQVEAQMNAGACLGRPAAQALPKLLLTPVSGCMAAAGTLQSSAFCSTPRLRTSGRGSSRTAARRRTGRSSPRSSWCVVESVRRAGRGLGGGAGDDGLRGLRGKGTETVHGWVYAWTPQRNVSMRYREGLPPVLQGISLEIRAREKIGIVGRTGAGKSSMIQVLFRMMEIFEGQILIDGLDIGTIGLHDLRNRLAISACPVRILCANRC